MNILICGADGFAGSAMCEALRAAGHRVLKGVRHAVRPDEIAVDFMRDTDSAIWQERLQGIHVLINAVGILAEGRDRRFDNIHTRTPIALFDAAHRMGLRRVIQLSALGAADGETAYFASKRAADEHLGRLPIAHHVLRPALLFGAAGASARFFRALASVPVHFLPSGGKQLLRPIHVDDLAEIVVRLVEGQSEQAQVLDLVGNTELSYRDMLAVYRQSMGFAPAWRVGVPGCLIATAAAVLDRVPGSILTRDTWRMLRRGNTADSGITAQALGRTPLGAAQFIAPAEAGRMRLEALSAWRARMMRGVLALIWIWTALCSVWLYPVADSLALLEQLSLQGSFARLALYGAAGLDLLLGVATLAWPGRRLWLVQMLLIGVYTLIIAVALPEFLFHPFGPVLKNAAVLALLLMLLSEEDRA